MCKNNHTSFCIICGKDFSDTVKPSKEHIIPEALGNEKLVTYCVCEKCNNDLGRNVDSYLTDYIFVKIVRKGNLEKDKDLQIFSSAMTDDKGNKYRITDQGPEIFPKVDIDNEKQSIHMEVASLEEGKKVAKGILDKKFKKSNDEIEEILSDSSTFAMSEIQDVEVGVFTQDAELDLARLKLAVIKIAFEYAVEKFRESYVTNVDAMILRAYLKAGREGKKKFTEEDYKIISERCHCRDSLIEDVGKYMEECQNELNSRKINHMVQILRDRDNKLICCVRLLDMNFLTFTVLLTKNASNLRGKEGYMTLILNDNSLLET